MDAEVAQIVSITAASPERAAQYLQLADGDLDSAIMLYLENNGADPTGGSAPEAVPVQQSSSSRRSPTGQSEDPIPIDEDNVSDDNDPEVTSFRRKNKSGTVPQPQSRGTTFDSDAEMARKLQEEMYGSGGNRGADDEDEIRAPIARQSETLLGPGADTTPLDDRELPAHVMQQMRRIQNRRAHQARPGIFNQRATSTIWNDQQNEDSPEPDLLAESTGGASESSSRSNMLAKMYQPPWELMFNGSWEDAREQGREDQKWMLVNIQESSVFDCQILNRDLWKNQSVVDTVKQNFIFLQYSKDDVRAEQYLQYYFHDHEDKHAYPHIAIVDPRTGEQLKVWSTEAPKPSEFLMQLHEFLDRYSLNSHARNPVAKRKSEAQKKKSVTEMTEEEQLERAMQASLAGQVDTSKLGVEDPDELTRSVGNIKPDSDSMSTGEDGNEAAVEASPFDKIPFDHPHTEPEPGADVTRIQFRHPAGRIIRRFNTSDPVQRIFEWLKSDPLEAKQGVGFDLVSMGKNLLEKLEQSIDEAGLKNGTVMVEFLEG